MNGLEIHIAHRIPGRIRLRLGRSPRQVDSFITHVAMHKGIEATQYTAITRSLLVIYNPSVVSSTEIIVRVGIALSLEYGNSSVEIVKDDYRHRLAPIDNYAVVSLVLAMVSRSVVLQQPQVKLLDLNAGFATLAAVLRHAWKEVQHEGIYDPEVISVVYLVNSMLKGNYLAASIITWIATFGRHLIVRSDERCGVEAMSVEDVDGRLYVDVVVKPYVEPQIARSPFKLLVVGLSRLVGLNPKRAQGSLYDQILQMSRRHGHVLEGVDTKPQPIYMRLEG
jgi:hypothetical protein